MAEYRSNSQRSREEEHREASQEKKIEKVVSGTAKRRKKTGLSKVMETFFQKDIHTVCEYLVEDILLPAAKRTFTDTVKNGIDMLVHGETRERGSGTNASRVSYRAYYDDKRKDRTSGYARSRESYSYDDIVFDNRGDCEEVLDRMDEIIQRYGFVSVADFLEMAGETPNHTDFKYGWDSLRGAIPKRVVDGYIITMPRAVPRD